MICFLLRDILHLFQQFLGPSIRLCHPFTILMEGRKVPKYTRHCSHIRNFCCLHKTNERSGIELPSPSFREYDEVSADDWISDIGIGDRIDCMDSKRVWYVGRIIGHCETDRFQYRIAYEGWSAKWHQWVDAHASSIAPLGTFTTGIPQSIQYQQRKPNSTQIDGDLDLMYQSYDRTMLLNAMVQFSDKDFSDVSVKLCYGESCKESIALFGFSNVLQIRSPAILEFLKACDVSKSDKEKCEHIGEVTALEERLHHYVIEIKDFPPSVWTALWEFIHSSRIPQLESFSHMSSLIILGISWHLSGLKQMVMSLTNTETTIDILAIIDQFVNRGIKYQCVCHSSIFFRELEMFCEKQRTEIEIQETVQDMKEWAMEKFKYNRTKIISKRGLEEKLENVSYSLLIELLKVENPEADASEYTHQVKRRRVAGEGFVRGVMSSRTAFTSRLPYTLPSFEKILKREKNRHHICDLEWTKEKLSKMQYAFDLDHLFFSASRESCDLTIELDDGVEYAHKCVLRGQSLFFNGLIDSSMQDNDRVNLKGLFRNRNSFLIILRHMYSGFIPPDLGTYSMDILGNIDFFGLKSRVLKKACMAAVLRSSTQKNFVELTHRCITEIKNKKLFAMLVHKHKGFLGKELIDYVYDPDVMFEMLRELLSRTDESNTTPSVLRELISKDQAEGYTDTLPALFILSDALEEFLNGLQIGTIDEIEERLQKHIKLVEPQRPNGSVRFDEVACDVFNAKEKTFSKRSGDFGDLLSSHLTRLRRSYV